MKRANTCATGLVTLCDNTGTDASAAAPSPPRTNTTDFLAITDYIRTTNLDKRDVVTLMDNLDKVINITGDRTDQVAEIKSDFTTTKTEMDNTNSLLSYLLISSLEKDDTVVNALNDGIRVLNRKIQQLSIPKTTTWHQHVLTKNAPAIMIAELENQIAALRGHLAHMNA